MRSSPVTLLALLGVAVILGGCMGGRPAGPVVSPTGIVYDLGTAPRESRYSQTATLYLRLDQNVEGALSLSMEGIENDPENPIHYFLAGVAHARLGEYVEADAMFVEAERIYPAYQLEIEPEREAAWANAFNQGAEAYAQGDPERAIRSWEQATLIYRLRPEAYRNLATALATEGRYDEAVDVYEQAMIDLQRLPATRFLQSQELEARIDAMRRMEENLAEILLFTERFAEAEPLFRRHLAEDPTNRDLQRNVALSLTGQGRHDEATEFYDVLLSEGEIASTQLFELAVALFRTGDFNRAGQAFGQLTELRPHSRDVWFNYANALFAAGDWDALVPVAERLRALDPLNENVGLIAARARLEIGDEEAALQRLQESEAAPAYVDGLVLRHDRGETSVSGRIVGNRAEPGTPIRLRFRFFGDTGELGDQIITLQVPASEQSEAFEVPFVGPATSYRYEVAHSGS